MLDRSSPSTPISMSCPSAALGDPSNPERHAAVAPRARQPERRSTESNNAEEANPQPRLAKLGLGSRR
eukprot:1695242-Alexandrium_andersonii.AAC.1